ncbi:MAG: sporulation integral membrane protein YtvI [Ruminococcus sp.]|nr:sporulation integral membrane protein YtvI [Ruminococcus sp.]MDY3894923.1 sporulation integral membrane protein YtvI [Candidatus Fimenecus sp.]
MDNITKRRNFIVNIVYITIIVGLFYLFMKYAFGVLSPFIIAMFIAMLLQKPVNFIIKKTKIPRGIVSTVAVLLVVFVFGTIIGLIISKIFSELKSFFNYIMLRLDNAPLFASQLKDWVNAHLTLLPDSIRQNIISTVANLIDKIQGVDTGSSSSAAAAVASTETTASKGFDFSSLSSPLSALWGTAKQIPQILVGTIVGIVCCCFMTSDYHTLRSLIMTQAGKRAGAFIRTKQIIFSTLGKMFRAYGLIMCITFLEMVLGLTILKLFGIYENGYIFAIALITAVIDIVPVLGTGTVLIPWAIWMFFSGDIAMGIGLLVVYGVITVIRQIIEPKLVASQLGLPAFVTLMAMYIGSQLFGFVGLFLLPMTVMLLKVLNDDGVIHIFKVPPEEAAEFKAAKAKDEENDAARKAKKLETGKKFKIGKKK